jgi:hypothetical protein
VEWKKQETFIGILGKPVPKRLLGISRIRQEYHTKLSKRKIHCEDAM